MSASYSPPRDVQIHELKVKEKLEGLTQKEKNYAHYMSRYSIAFHFSGYFNTTPRVCIVNQSSEQHGMGHALFSVKSPQKP
jgi:hypothetical protein